jgi:hypothetical protein
MRKKVIKVINLFKKISGDNGKKIKKGMEFPGGHKIIRVHKRKGVIRCSCRRIDTYHPIIRKGKGIDFTTTIKKPMNI